MKVQKSFEDSLILAERDCFDKLCDILGLEQGRNAFLYTNGGAADCMVFDAGYPETGDVLAFPAETLHFRGQADLYNRDPKMLKRWLMRIVGAMPIGVGSSTDETMPENSNVVQFRVAPITNGASGMSTTQLKYGAGDKGIEVFTITVSFDIIFNTGSRSVG